MKQTKKLNSKAVIGIGTLIVFIAMVLVAGIASAVIIWTAENLEEDAERTGAGAREDVTGGIHVKNVEGQVDDIGGGTIELTTVFVYIALYGGSEEVDMNQVVAHIVVKPNGGIWASEDHLYNDAAPGTADITATDAWYGTEAVSDPLSAGPPTGDTLDQQSIFKLTIILDDTDSNLDTLPPNSYLEIHLMQSKGGPTTIEEVKTPSGYPAALSIVDLDN